MVLLLLERIAEAVGDEFHLTRGEATAVGTIAIIGKLAHKDRIVVDESYELMSCTISASPWEVGLSKIRFVDKRVFHCANYVS